MSEEIAVEDTSPIALEDKVEDLFESPGGAIISTITDRFTRSKHNRRETEDRWLKSYTNFRGRYGDDVEFLETEVSRVFIKVTKTKTLAAYGQLLDVLLGGPKFPISVGPTEKPTGVVETIHIDPSQPDEGDTSEEASMEDLDPIGYEGDGNDVRSDEGLMERAKRLVMEKLNLKGGDLKIKEGGANKPGMITLSPAQIAGEEMTSRIQDQLTEGKMTREFRKFLFENVMLGSGCLKGPYYSEKESPNWNEEGTYTPTKSIIPITKFSSVWNNYPDDNASSIEDAEWHIERHRMSKQDLRALRTQPHFRKNAIDEVIEMSPNYTDEHWEQDLREGDDTRTAERWEVLEYWGTLETEDVLELDDFEMPEGVVVGDEVSVNVFISGGVILRLIINPFKPNRIPYYICPYEEDPYNLFGVGVPENMEDSQTLMNGFARMGVDNAVLAGQIMLEVDTDNLEPGQTMDIYGGKIWQRQGGQPGTTINAITFPNTASSNMMMYDKFRALADESTGISSFSHGQTGVSGVGRTAAGISMLMNASSGSVKTVIMNIDDYVLEPLGRAYFAFNMQFNFDKTMVGDLEVKAMGVASLMQKEVRSQRLLQLVQVVAGDPELSARLNKEYVLKELAKALELDPDKIVLSQEEAALVATLFPTSPIAEEVAADGAASPTDQIGGGNGNIGVGAPPLPGEPQFSGNGEQGGSNV